MHLAHSHLPGGHLGAWNIREKLKDQFVWPKMDAEVRAFCQSCPQRERTTPQKPALAPLIPLVGHVGIPKDILTNQDMPFRSKLMVDRCWLL